LIDYRKLVTVVVELVQKDSGNTGHIDIVPPGLGSEGQAEDEQQEECEKMQICAFLKGGVHDLLFGFGVVNDYSILIPKSVYLLLQADLLFGSNPLETNQIGNVIKRWYAGRVSLSCP
jgi:hypothetical protein